MTEKELEPNKSVFHNPTYVYNTTITATNQGLAIWGLSSLVGQLKIQGRTYQIWMIQPKSLNLHNIV